MRGPEARVFHGRDASEELSRLLESAKQSIWVVTAFLDDCGVELLRRACERGVDVKALVSTAVDRRVLDTLAQWAEVRIFKERFLHAKLYIADGRALQGSANLTCGALYGNVEVLSEVDASDAVRIFRELWAKATPYQPKVPEEPLEARIAGKYLALSVPGYPTVRISLTTPQTLVGDYAIPLAPIQVSIQQRYWASSIEIVLETVEERFSTSGQYFIDRLIDKMEKFEDLEIPRKAYTTLATVFLTFIRHLARASEKMRPLVEAHLRAVEEAVQKALKSLGYADLLRRLSSNASQTLTLDLIDEPTLTARLTVSINIQLPDKTPREEVAMKLRESLREMGLSELPNQLAAQAFKTLKHVTCPLRKTCRAALEVDIAGIKLTREGEYPPE